MADSSSERAKATTRGQLKSYFGLSHEELEDFLTAVVCPAYDAADDLLANLVCAEVLEKGPDGRCSTLNIAFLQWSSSRVTSLQGEASIAQADSTILGFPEISYFLSNLFLAESSPYVPAGAAYQFAGLSFGNDWDFALLDYHRLSPACLLYLETMRELLAVGDAFNITASSSTDPSSGKLLTDYSSFGSVATTLNVTEPASYALYAYLDSLIARTLVRSQEGGSGQLLALANFATSGLKTAVDDTLTYYFPRALHASMMQTSFAAANCSSQVARYVPSLPANSSSFARICANSSLSFASPRSYYNWLRLFSDQYDDALAVFVENEIDLVAVTPDLFNKTGNFSRDLGAAREAVYNSTVEASAPCSFLNSTLKQCSDYETGLLQWSTSQISTHPPFQLYDLFARGVSARDFIRNVTGLDFSFPEFYFFSLNSWMFPLPGYSPLDAYNLLTSSHAFNLKVAQDLFLNQSDAGPSANATRLWRDYMRYMALEFGMGGLFKTVTVYEAIHGYEDALLQGIKETPVYAGGTPYLSSTLAIFKPNPTSLAFFTGADDYSLGKVYAAYHGSPTIMVPRQQPKGNGSEFDSVLVNPWRTELPLKGTDATKFPAQMSKGDRFWTFVTDIMIPLEFNFQGEASKSGLTTYEYALEPDMLKSSRDNPVNHNYYMDKYDGVANLTSFAQAAAYGSQAHYFGVPADQPGMRLPVLCDASGEQIMPDPANDLNHFFLEYYTGAQVKGFQRLMVGSASLSEQLLRGAQSAVQHDLAEGWQRVRVPCAARVCAALNRPLLFADGLAVRGNQERARPPAGPHHRGLHPLRPLRWAHDLDARSAPQGDASRKLPPPR